MQSTIKDLQTSEDPKFIIGQLHQRLLGLQKAESASSAQAQDLKIKSLRLEKIILQVSDDCLRSLKPRTAFKAK